MTGSKAAGVPPAVARFWHNYLSILEKASIPQQARVWYRRHAEAYIKAHPELKLAHHTPQQVDA